jgi:FtsH-binding integral membrane protein
MADYQNPTSRYGKTAAVPTAGAIDEGLRAHMLRVYNYMMIGLGITGVVALAIYNLAVTTTPTAGALILRDGLYLTSLGETIYTSPLQWVIIFAPLAMVFFISFRLQKMSVGAAQISFWVFAGLMGLSLSSIFLVYTSESIVQVFFITAATFGAMSLWGYTTKRDLTGFGSFLFMGLIGLIIAMLVNLFMQSSALGFLISIVGVLIFTGLTAYDTQKIKEMYYAGDDGTVAGRKAIMGALALYLDFINLFLMLLRLLGNRN